MSNIRKYAFSIMAVLILIFIMLRVKYFCDYWKLVKKEGIYVFIDESDLYCPVCVDQFLGVCKRLERFKDIININMFISVRERNKFIIHQVKGFKKNNNLSFDVILIQNKISGFVLLNKDHCMIRWKLPLNEKDYKSISKYILDVR